MYTRKEQGKPQHFAFPKLMIRKEGDIVLFSGMSAGTVVHKESDSFWSVGYHSTVWERSDFVDYYDDLWMSN